jgi:hypothetical protein
MPSACDDGGSHAGACEHPERNIPDKPVEQVHAEVAAGALADAGLTFADVDGCYCAGDTPGFGGISMADYLGLNLTLQIGDRVEVTFHDTGQGAARPRFRPAGR